MSVLTTKPKFLYPHARQFPFDEVAEKIVKALEKRNWKVPGINVEFDTYGSGEAKYQLVRYIEGDDFKLFFCRTQDTLDSRWCDTAAVHEIYIPKQIMVVYADESGPTYYLYVGDNWDEDKNWFMNSTKVNSKLNKEPRRYLLYRGNTYKQRAKCLVHDNDLGREYAPRCNEPRTINLDKKFKEFKDWLEEHVLKYILTFPEADIIESPIAEKELTPYNGPWPLVFSTCDGKNAERMIKCKENPEQLLPEERFVRLNHSGRVVPLDIDSKIKFPEIAYEGFYWCDVNQNITPESSLDEISSYARGWSIAYSMYIVALKLKFSNDVYVIDNATFYEERKKIFETIAPRNRLTEEELWDCDAARAATIVPINEYRGGYKKPLVLIERELDFDEVEWISKVKN